MSNNQSWGYSGQRQITPVHGGIPKGPFKYFMPGVREIFASTKSRNTQYRILPDFDWKKAGTPEFATSWISSRDFTHLLNGQASLSNFYAKVREYTFFGNAEAQFISPATYRYMPWVEIDETLTIDPIWVIANHCKQAEEGSEWHKLHKKKVKTNFGEGNWMPKSKETILLNAAKIDSATRRVKDAERDVGVMRLPSYGWDESTVKGALMIPMVQGEGIVPLTDDEAGKKFLLGDFTHPKHGLVATLAEVTAGQSRMTGFIFGNENPYTQDGLMKCPVDNKVLAKRVPLLDPKTIFIPTPQEIVDFIVDDGFFPLELVKEALENYDLIIKSPTKPRRHEEDDDAPDEDDEDAKEAKRLADIQARKKAAGAPAPAAKPAAKPAAPADEDVDPATPAPRVTPSIDKKATARFWVSHDDDDVELKTEPEIIVACTQGKYNGTTQLMREGTEEWESIKDAHAHFLPKKAEAPAKPSAPAKPAAPAAPAKPSAPAKPAAKVVKGAGENLEGMDPDPEIDETLNAAYPAFEASDEDEDKRLFRRVAKKQMDCLEPLTEAEQAAYDRLEAKYNG